MPKTRALNATAEYALLAQRFGGKEAYEALVKRIEKRLARFCLLLTRNREIAEDLRQEVFLKVMSHLDTLEDVTRFTSWLFMIARNDFLNYVKKADNRPKRPLEEVSEGHPAPSSAEIPFFEIERFLGALNAEDRMCVLLVLMERASYAEAAEMMGVTEDSIRSRIKRIRQRFRSAFQTMEASLPKA